MFLMSLRVRDNNTAFIEAASVSFDYDFLQYQESLRDYQKKLFYMEY